ncbi:DUF262 domain-containing protein [Flavobacterium sp. FZUC8N2.13]|uniref:DUF262 domain-containing protein n=1 Tax=Flavobacterium zubiriense TaxID=3138075 RepID=A0ABV4TDH9_9FLAO
MEVLEINQKTLKSYSLEEISKWQQEVTGERSKIFLPSLQRGFVWKPSQIEALWDSIFRGYPIGAILMSIDYEDNRNLLDGQQRCTSIALGHFDPFKDNLKEYLSVKSYKPSVWIDLAPEQQVIGQKFIFRCLTQSHPWGYQLNDSNNTLSMSERRKSMDYFKSKSEKNVERYTDLTSDLINPWDAYYPIPLSFILSIEVQNEVEFRNVLFQKTGKLKIKTKHSNNEFVNFSKISDSQFSLIYEGFLNYKKLLIPEITVESKVLKEDDETLKSESEDPTLFVRLNSAGTRISGEELNYSIYKACFPKVKDLVEKIGASYLAPSKVISLFSRLSACEQNNFSQYQKEFSIQNFKKKISDDNFKDILQNNIETEATTLIENAIIILKKQDDDFPVILLKQIIVSNTDLFFILLTYIKKLGFQNLSDSEKKDIASSYVYILWFCKDNKKIASALFVILFNNANVISWKKALEILVEENKILPIVNPSFIRSNLENIVIKNKINYNDFDRIISDKLFCDDIETFLNQCDEENIVNKNWNMLIHKIYHNKSLLLYAQKGYMNSKFKEFSQFESIDDTNRPWDWDHIYPHSWVYNKEGINQRVKKWVNCIGNFRALSYDDNRSENNHLSPKDRFENDNKKEESFVNSDIQYWNEIDHTFRRIKQEEDEKVTVLLNAVISRMVNIYENLFENYFEF